MEEFGRNLCFNFRYIRMKIVLLTFFSLAILLPSSALAQLSEKDVVYFSRYQDTLVKMANQLYKLKDDSSKLKLNQLFSEKWEEVLLNNLSFYFGFDSVTKDVGVLKSPDNKFRIINWDLLLKDGTHMYYGFVQAKHPKTGKYEVYELNDVSEIAKNPETHSADYTRWYGMLYFKIIPCDGYYVLLGLDEYDRTASRKMIDVISFKSDGVPLFGKGVFTKIPKKFPKRFVLEYSAETSVFIQYDERKKHLVFNHVAAPDQYLEGQFQFYVPDGSYDYFEYKKGNWEYHDDYDARNEKSPLDKVKTPKRNEKPVFVPN